MGTVRDKAQMPVSGVRVTLEAENPPEKANGPNHRQVVVTGSSGQFQFTYISYDRRLPYRLTFEAAGCSSIIITGLSGERKEHHVTLQSCEAR